MIVRGASALVLVVGVLATSMSMQAQQRQSERTADRAVAQPAKPAPEMEKRKWVVGKWSVSERHEKSDSSPRGTGKGTSVISLGPGGYSQTITYDSVGPNGPFSGHGIIAWDPESKLYRSAWTDSMTPGIVLSNCREEGKDWVCSAEGMMRGKKTVTRSRSIAPNPAGWAEVTEVSIDGGPFMKVRTFEFTRAK
jgi:hypothetical protein